MENKLLEALNRMDEYATLAVEDYETNDEVKQLAKDYKLLADYIIKNNK